MYFNSSIMHLSEPTFSEAKAWSFFINHPLKDKVDLNFHSSSPLLLVFLVTCHFQNFPYGHSQFLPLALLVGK